MLEGIPGVDFLQESDAGVLQTAAPGHDPVYFIALCAADPDCLPRVQNGLSLFDDSAESVYRHYYHEIRKNMAAGEILAGKDRELAGLRAALGSGSSAERSRPWWRRLFGGR